MAQSTRDAAVAAPRKELTPKGRLRVGVNLGNFLLVIRKAVQDLFKVTVTDVRTVVVRGKVKRVGRFQGQRPSWKKAFVTLKAGDNIEFFEGV